ncbi:hypothetical protein ACH46_00820 [Gordonia phthalatica]|uniref:Uncharacterized protein n=2 Tax=Gordonia phthalatica TaxID=1136941 RepID=A0A0N9NDS9_9ACTN|nr:hypothetical protein ACH46_00820 [Gordonia phthalatica]
MLVSAAAVGLVFGSAPQAAAQPPTPHRVDQLGDIVYDQLFTVGVQVYERVETRRQTVYAPQPVTNYIPVLRRLHSPREGKPGSLRYGFLGSPLPEAFATQGTLGRSSARLGTGHIVTLNPRTLGPSDHYSQLCVSDPLDGRRIGPLAGGSLALWCPS